MAIMANSTYSHYRHEQQFYAYQVGWIVIEVFCYLDVLLRVLPELLPFPQCI